MPAKVKLLPIIPHEMVLVVFALAVVILGDSLIYIVLPASFREFGISDTFGISAAFWIGFALSINRFIRIASNSLAAQIYQRYGFRTPFIGATLLGVATTLSYGFTRGILLLLLARALWGVAYSHLRLGVYITAFEVGGSAHRGRLLGFYNAGQRAGSFIAVTAGAVLADFATRGTTFTLVAAVGLLGVLVALRVPRVNISLSESNRNSHSVVTTNSRGRFWRLAISAGAEATRVTRRRMLAISILRFSTAFAANGLAIATISPFLTELFEQDKTLFGFSVSIIMLAGVLVGFRWFSSLALGIPLGHLSDRIGRRRSIMYGGIFMLGSLAVLAILPTRELVIVAIPILFLMGAGMEAAVDAAMGEASPPSMLAPAMARYSTWLDLGAATGPIIGFVIGDFLGFSAGYGIAAGMIAVALPIYFFTTRPITGTN